MEIFRMKNRTLCSGLLLAALVTLFSGCKDDNLYNPAYAEELKSQLFDFNLRQTVNVDINYGIADYHALVLLFDEYPLTEEGQLKGLNPIFSSYTDENCRLQASVEIPSAVKTVYIYSPTYWIPRLTETIVENGCIVLDTTTDEEKTLRSLDKGVRVVDSPRILSTVDASKKIYALVDWNWCGQITDKNGIMKTNSGGLAQRDLEKLQSFLWKGYKNKTEAVAHNIDNSYLLRPTKVVNTTIAKAYENEKGETVLTKDAEISFTFINERAGWQNVMGYYYYPADECPNSPEAVKKFLIIPNASISTDSDPRYYTEKNNKGEVSPINKNATFQLLFEQEDGTLTTHFPPGYTIGYFVIADGFTPESCTKKGTNYTKNNGNEKGKIEFNNGDVFYSNAEWNKEYNDKKERFISVSLEDGRVIYGIEDGGDNSYEDILFMISANPNEAIQDPDRPVIDPEEQTTTAAFGSGIYAFEDIWSSGGDYDMNDVIVKYERSYTYDLYNQVKKIKEVYTPVHNGATYHDSFGYQLPANITSSDISSVTVNGAPASFEAKQNLLTVLLFEDIQSQSGEPYTIEFTMSAGSKLKTTDIKNSAYNPFIVVPELSKPNSNLRLEVHLPKYEVTALGWPGAGEKWNLWFVGRFQGQGDLQFPFAIDIPYQNFKPAVETVLITEAYPEFKGWDENKGTINADWYKKPVAEKVQEFSMDGLNGGI